MVKVVKLRYDTCLTSVPFHLLLRFVIRLPSALGGQDTEEGKLLGSEGLGARAGQKEQRLLLQCFTAMLEQEVCRTGNALEPLERLGHLGLALHFVNGLKVHVQILPRRVGQDARSAVVDNPLSRGERNGFYQCPL